MLTEKQQALIEKMRTMHIVGNADGDRNLWCVCHDVAADETMPMENRLESLAKMNELTGEDDPCDENALKEYLNLES